MLRDPTIKPLNLNLLIKEYTDWTIKYGDRRNGNDWRFGQYLVNTYAHDPIGLFYVESAKEAYNIMSKHLETLHG